MDGLREAFERSARINGVPGAQLVVRHCGTTWEWTFGELRHGANRAMSRDTKVPIGSITKSFTATLLMVLVSDGDIELDAPVAEYLPEVRRSQNALLGQLTPRHLLSHTGGLRSEVAPPSADGRQPLASSLLEVLQPPGTAFSYSNAGYALAGRLVEVTTGMSWQEAMQTILLKPLDITAAFIAGEDLGKGTLAIASGHTVNRALRRVLPVEQELEPVEAPAGGLAVSATDLVALAAMHLRPEHGGCDQELVAPADLDEMRRPVPHAEPFGLADGWGLGLALFTGGTERLGNDQAGDDRLGTDWLGHDGTADGTSCHLRLNPDSGAVVAFTSNSASGAAMWRELLPELRSAGLDLGGYAGAVVMGRPVSPPHDCAGTYVNGDTAYSVVVRDQEVHLVVDGDHAAELVVHDGLVFSVRDAVSGETGHPGRFLRDPRSGRIDRIQIGGRVASRRERAREVA